MKDEQALEQEIQAKGLNAPRLNPKMIDDAIMSEQYHVFPGTTLTVCALTLRNGYIVTGESASASPENFNVEIGRKIAHDNARNKIWALEGYLLREKLGGLGGAIAGGNVAGHSCSQDRYPQGLCAASSIATLSSDGM